MSNFFYRKHFSIEIVLKESEQVMKKHLTKKKRHSLIFSDIEDGIVLMVKDGRFSMIGNR